MHSGSGGSPKVLGPAGPPPCLGGCAGLVLGTGQPPPHPRDFTPACFLPWHEGCPPQCPQDLGLGSDPRARGAKVRTRKGLKVRPRWATSSQLLRGWFLVLVRARPQDLMGTCPGPVELDTHSRVGMGLLGGKPPRVMDLQPHG